MSLSTFKSNLIRFMESEPQSSDDFAKTLTREYDLAVKRGGDLLNSVPLQKGNTEGMETILKLFLKSNMSKQSGVLDIQDWGFSFLTYWMPAQGALFPVPAIPAPGTIQNISSNTHILVNPGNWSTSFPTPPTNSISQFVDILTLGIQTHLTTVQGMIITTSLYPTAPAPTPGPGIINWTGYVIPG